MRKQFAKALVAILVSLGLVALFVSLEWGEFFRPYPGLGWPGLGWPGLLLARLGLAHAWWIGAAVPLGILLGLSWWARKRPWWQLLTMSLALSAFYCGLDYFHAMHMPVPLPATTPYDADAAKKAEYLAAYKIGYREGVMGLFRTYCFRPEAETRGCYEGDYAGGQVLFRFLGREMPKRLKVWLHSSAVLDNTEVDLP